MTELGTRLLFIGTMLFSRDGEVYNVLICRVEEPLFKFYDINIFKYWFGCQHGLLNSVV